MLLRAHRESCAAGQPQQRPVQAKSGPSRGVSAREMLSRASKSFVSLRITGYPGDMQAVSSFLWHLCSCFGVLLHLLGYALSFSWALLLPRAVTATQLVAIQSRLAAELDRFSVRRTRHSQFIGTLRRELLAHVIVVNQRHLERLLGEHLDHHYHTARPHQGLSGETPVPQAPPGEGELISVPVVGGLHHRYYRAAA